MSDVLTTLTSVAVAVFRERAAPDYEASAPWYEPIWESDPVLGSAQIAAFVLPDRHPALTDVAKKVFTEPEFASLGPREGELDPMLLHPGGGSRLPASSLVTGLFASAFLQMYYLRLTWDEGTFVRTVLEGFEELRRGARGERIRAHIILGISGVNLPEGSQVSTPWGVLRPAPPPRRERVLLDVWQPQTTCLLAESRLLPVRFDRAREPKSDFDHSEITAGRSRILFPLACALASKDLANPAVPLVTWSTLLLPFQYGFSYSKPLLPRRLNQGVDIGDRVAEVEDWARIVEGSHAPTVDVAVRRLVSAAAARTDRSDALIDAVMVWENLVGTSTEVTFRVTAALAKALEPDRTKRRALRKSLAQVYDIRSRVVHGVAVDQSAVNDAATQAIEVAIRVLQMSYRRGQPWLVLSSTERADSLLLEEP